MVADLVPSHIHKYFLRVDTFLVNRALFICAVLILEKAMVFSPEHFIVLLSQFFLRCFGQIMDRFSRLIVQKQTRRMQIKLDFLNA